MAGTNIYGELVRAQLQNSGSDLTPVANGLLYFNTSTGVKWYNGSAWKTAADLNSAQVFTAKDIDGGTASNTSRITLPKDTKANLDALTRKAGTIVWSTDLLKAYVDDGAQLIPIGSGGQDYLLTTNETTLNGTIVIGDTALYPNLEIPLTFTWTVNNGGSLISITQLLVDGDLEVDVGGEVRIL